MLIGSSHKYREVIRMFELENLAMGYEDVSVENLAQRFEQMVGDESNIRGLLSVPSVPSVARIKLVKARFARKRPLPCGPALG